MKDYTVKLEEDISDIIYNSVSPSRKLCSLAETLETMTVNVRDEPSLKQMQSSLQDVFFEDLTKALSLTNKKHMDAIDYNEWVLASDAFMLNKYDVVAKALEIRSMTENNDKELSVFIVENIKNIQPLIDKLLDVNIGNAKNKAGGLEILLHTNHKYLELKGSYNDNVLYAQNKIEDLKENDIQSEFKKTMVKTLNNIMAIDVAKNKKISMR